MPATEKLYWDDPFATVVETDALRFDAPPAAGAPASVVLDRTVFYPEGGGQLGDRGALRVRLEGEEIACAVVDTQIDDQGEIRHLLDDASAAVLGARVPGGVRHGASIVGTLDTDRRDDQRAHHTAQHLVSAMLLDLAAGETASARLGPGECTIDVRLESLPDAVLARVEDATNGAIRADVAVRASFPSTAELAAMKLRRAPKVASGIRVITIDGLDLTPCGGTHVLRTGQIGLVRVTRVERYKGMTRVTFEAAHRAIAASRARDRALVGIARELSAPPLEVGAAVARLRAESRERAEALGHARAEIATLLAERELAALPAPDGSRRVVAVDHAGLDVATLRTLAGRLASRPDVLAVCVSADASQGAAHVVVQRGAACDVDCGALLKSAAARAGGRGGGGPERAEGRFPTGTVARELAKSLAMPEPGEARSSTGAVPRDA